MCVAFELEANIMAKMTREQQEKLCDIYNASDIEALDYMYEFFEGLNDYFDGAMSI